MGDRQAALGTRRAFSSCGENHSFAPLGLYSFSFLTRGLRPGLHSFAALRLRLPAARLSADVWYQERSRLLTLRLDSSVQVYQPAMHKLTIESIL